MSVPARTYSPDGLVIYFILRVDCWYDRASIRHPVTGRINRYCIDLRADDVLHSGLLHTFADECFISYHTDSVLTMCHAVATAVLCCEASDWFAGGFIYR